MSKVLSATTKISPLTAKINQKYLQTSAPPEKPGVKYIDGLASNGSDNTKYVQRGYFANDNYTV